MKRLIHLAHFFLLIVLTALSHNAFSEPKEWGWELRNYLVAIYKEYSYYADISDDGNDFPVAREQEILTHIENTFLKEHAKETFSTEVVFGIVKPLANVTSIAMAKLLLYYGDIPFFRENDGSVPIIRVADQTKRYKKVPVLNHDEVIKIIKENAWGGPKWTDDLPSNNSIGLIKLFVSLGDDIQIRTKGNEIDADALTASIYSYSPDEGWAEENIPYIRPDEKHRAEDILRRYPDNYDDDTFNNSIKYRSPVTYWLEEFIEAGYPASMLDTHKLHYPRFMKEASVAEITAMLNNPETHKIPANINCPYQRKQGAGDEVAQAVSPAELCPLTPSVNMRDAMGRTPLHIAGEQGNKAVFNALIQTGADESVKDYRGNLPRI